MYKLENKLWNILYYRQKRWKSRIGLGVTPVTWTVYLFHLMFVWSLMVKQITAIVFDLTHLVFLQKIWTITYSWVVTSQKQMNRYKVFYMKVLTNFLRNPKNVRFWHNDAEVISSETRTDIQLFLFVINVHYNQLYWYSKFHF